MPFSIPVSELTQEMLAKSEYWKLYGFEPDGSMWANTRPSKKLVAVPANEEHHGGYLIECTGSDDEYYDDRTRCLPITITPDGTEIRLECPRLPDEPLIAEWRHVVKPEECHAYHLEDSPEYWRLQRGSTPLMAWTLAPSPNHHPRLTLEGTWVWSTRR